MVEAGEGIWARVGGEKGLSARDCGAKGLRELGTWGFGEKGKFHFLIEYGTPDFEITLGKYPLLFNIIEQDIFDADGKGSCHPLK